MHTTSPHKKPILYLACTVLFSELVYLWYFFSEILLWLEHHLWVVVLPFSKALIKHLVAMKVIQFLKILVLLLWHCFKLGLMKLIKTIGLRYGLYFSQYRWRTIRWLKLTFLRKGQLFFRRTEKFWLGFNHLEKYLLIGAFFPIVLLIFILGLSFNMTRKTLIQKTQETAMAKMAASASTQSKGLNALIERVDHKIVKKIKQLQKK